MIGRGAAALAAGEVVFPRATGRRAVAVVTLVLAAVIGAVPFVLARQGDPEWPRTVPMAAWAVIVALLFSARLGRDAEAALRLMRVGAAGFLLLLASAAPPIIAARESGASLFAPAGGREVLAWRAWRTAWMAGYFYNDGRVREVETLAEITAAAAREPVLVLSGPREREDLRRVPGLRVTILSRAPATTPSSASNARRNAGQQTKRRERRDPQRAQRNESNLPLRSLRSSAFSALSSLSRSSEGQALTSASVTGSFFSMRTTVPPRAGKA